MASRDRRGPSYLKRIETRARTLREDPNFTNHLASRRRNWNEAFPEFRVSGTGIMPEHIGACGGLPIPPTLDRALDHADTGALTDQDAKTAKYLVSEWAGMCFLVSNMFWPAADFPHVLPLLKHPAMPFVSLCLIFDPRAIDPDNAWSHTLHPLRFGYDPTRPETDPHMAMRGAMLRSLSDALVRAENEGRGLSSEEVGEARQIANAAGWRAYFEAYNSFDLDDPSAGYYYLPVIPGLRSQDVRESEQSILECSARLSGTDDFIRQRIRECLAAGQSHEMVARRLGVSRATVSNAARNR
ncbi:hypothetical protein BH23CHL5_BH23CHL5_23160 [soil metagenome]